jgi:mono/diheme cytochrome c family protein
MLGAVRRPLRPLLVLVFALAALGVFAGGLAWLLDNPRPLPGASRGERVFVALCAECHGADGRGSWRATLFLIRPGDFTDPARTGRESDQYLVDIIKNGGAPIGRPGMPAFGAALKDDDIRELVAYVRGLARAR